eukprot:759213-Hanusia_phi.AAC.1
MALTEVKTLKESADEIQAELHEHIAAVQLEGRKEGERPERQGEEEETKEQAFDTIVEEVLQEQSCIYDGIREKLDAILRRYRAIGEEMEEVRRREADLQDKLGKSSEVASLEEELEYLRGRNEELQAELNSTSRRCQTLQESTEVRFQEVKREAFMMSSQRMEEMEKLHSEAYEVLTKRIEFLQEVTTPPIPHSLPFLYSLLGLNLCAGACREGR